MLYNRQKLICCINNGIKMKKRCFWIALFKQEKLILFYFVCVEASQSTIFQSCRDGATASWVINQYFQGVKCLAQGHNMAAVGFEPPTSRSGVRHSTTEPPRSRCFNCQASNENLILTSKKLSRTKIPRFFIACNFLQSFTLFSRACGNHVT